MKTTTKFGIIAIFMVLIVASIAPVSAETSDYGIIYDNNINSVTPGMNAYYDDSVRPIVDQYIYSSQFGSSNYQIIDNSNAYGNRIIQSSRDYQYGISNIIDADNINYATPGYTEGANYGNYVSQLIYSSQSGISNRLYETNVNYYGNNVGQSIDSYQYYNNNLQMLNNINNGGDNVGQHINSLQNGESNQQYLTNTNNGNGVLQTISAYQGSWGSEVIS